jgi:hypothetical protein
MAAWPAGPSSDANGVLRHGLSNKAVSQCAGVRRIDELPILGHIRAAILRTS